MRSIWTFSLLLLIFLSCQNNNKSSVINNTEEEPELPDTTKDVVAFFPVTDFIKGEIEKIKLSGKNPIKYFKNKENKDDSIWIKVQELESEFKEFYTPIIDSANDSKYYVEKKFVDNSINAITLTYDPLGDLPINKPWKHWDIYINPEFDSVLESRFIESLKCDHGSTGTVFCGPSITTTGTQTPHRPPAHWAYMETWPCATTGAVLRTIPSH